MSNNQMTLNEYQDRAASSCVYPDIKIIIDGGEPIDAPWLLSILGLCGEVGELAEKFKKFIRDGKGVMTIEHANAIKGERGDPLWYLAMLAKGAGSTLADDAQYNLDKIASRKARGTLNGSGDNR